MGRIFRWSPISLFPTPAPPPTSHRLVQSPRQSRLGIRPWFWCARRESFIAHQAVNAASFQPMNRTYVVSVEDLETLISEARHLASEGDASDRLPVVVDSEDLAGELELARATGGSGSSPAGLEGELLADAYRCRTVSTSPIPPATPTCLIGPTS